jgi:N4-gp56 family major capsid protein
MIAMLNKLFKINLRLFDNTNTTGDADLSPEMKTYYDKDLLRNAKPKLVHNRYGQKRPIPKGKGKTIEFRKFDPLPKALTPLTEGVTPNGRKMRVTSITATVKQYGDYIEHSDMLELTTIDNTVVEGNRLLGQQSGETLDTITREVINGGSNVQYGTAQKAARYLLIGGDATFANNDYFNCEMIRQGALNLRNNKASGIEGGDFLAIVHPDTTYSLKKDTEWQEAVKYQNSEKLFDGEVGKYDGVRIVETTEAKIFHAADLSVANRNLTVASLAGKVFTVSEALTEGDATALAGRKILVKGYLYTVASAAAGAAGAATVTVNEAVQGSPANGEKVYPGEAGAQGRDVYSALFIGADAYGTTDIEGGGLQMIVKQLGSAGTADPLNQRATQGWKATHVAEILSDLFMVRVEHTTPYQRGAN